MRVVVLLMGLAGLAHLNRVGISVVGDEVFIRRMGIDPVDMGWVYTGFLIVYTLGMLPGGWLIDRIGSARALTLMGAGMGTLVVLTGVLGWLTSSTGALLAGLLVIRGLAGLCNAPLHPGAAHQVSEILPGPSRATGNGLVTAGAVLGIAACYPVVGFLIDRLEWNWAFIIPGAVLIAYGLLWRVLSPPVPAAQPVPSATGQEPQASTAERFSDLLQSRGVVLLALSYAAYSYFQYLFFYWMGYYFKEVLHIPDAAARRSTTMVMLSMGAGMVLGGLITDQLCRHLGPRRGRQAVVMTGLVLGSAFGLLGVLLREQSAVLVCLSLSMGLLGMCEGVFWTTATDLGRNSRGLSGAFLNTVGNVGGLISPVLTPVLGKHLGWPGAIAVACVISAAGGVAWFWISAPPSADVTTPEELVRVEA
jgi:MFS family permease